MFVNLRIKRFYCYQ